MRGEAHEAAARVVVRAGDDRIDRLRLIGHSCSVFFVAAEAHGPAAGAVADIVLPRLEVGAEDGMAADGDLLAHRVDAGQGPAVEVQRLDDDPVKVVAAGRLVEDPLDGADRGRRAERRLGGRVGEPGARGDHPGGVVGRPAQQVQRAAVASVQRPRHAVSRHARGLGRRQDVARPLGCSALGSPQQHGGKHQQQRPRQRHWLGGGG